MAIDPGAATAEQFAAARTTIAEFEVAFSAHGPCIDRASVSFAQLDQSGEYQPAAEQVLIDVDLPPDQVRMALLHELGHHVSVHCGAIDDPGFTAAFYRAQGIPSQRDWYDFSAGWTANPAEQLAEAIVKMISGHQNSSVPIAAASVEVVSAWANGHPLG
jgi:hypothetical protein